MLILKYLFSLFFIILLFVGCAEDSNNNASDISNVFLIYNDDSSEITGEVTLSMETVPNNHTITLSDFTPVVEGCSVNTLKSTVSPNSAIFSALNQTHTLAIDVKFLAPCSNTKLTLKTKKKDSSVLGKKVIVRTTDTSYEFLVQKPTVTPNTFKSILKESSLNITQNSQTSNVIVSVYDAHSSPVKDGVVKIIYPDVVTSGVNVGSFSPSEAEIKDGSATFVYTAPNDLTQTTKDINTTSFKFYYNDIVTNATTLNVTYNPETNQTIHKTYSLLFQPQNNTYKMSLKESKTFSISLIDDSDVAVSDADIYDMNVSLENSSIASLLNPQGSEGSKFIFNNQNNITMTLKSRTISGLVPIHVSARFKDANGNDQNINNTFNIIVESGPPTAISISYTSTDQDKQRGKFIEHFAVSVTDKYFNPVNTNPQVSVGAIVGYASPDGNSSHRIFDNSTDANAILTPTTLNLNANVIDIASTDIDINNDTLVTFGNGYKYPASGGWSFDSFTSNSISLLADQYDGNSTGKLGYAIGRNYRQDRCKFGEEWLGQAKLQDGVTTLDLSGTAVVDLSYDYYLVGKDILLYINIIGKDNNLDRTLKIGEAKKHTLRGHGLELVSEPTLEATNGNANRKFRVWVKDANIPYRNARFSFRKVEESGSGHIISGSITQRPIDECGENDGYAYVEYAISADLNETFSIEVSEPYINNEF